MLLKCIILCSLYLFSSNACHCIDYNLFCCKINGLIYSFFLVVKLMSCFLLSARVSSLHLDIFNSWLPLFWSKEQPGDGIGFLTGGPHTLFTWKVQRPREEGKNTCRQKLICISQVHLNKKVCSVDIKLRNISVIIVLHNTISIMNAINT